MGTVTATVKVAVTYRHGVMWSHVHHMTATVKVAVTVPIAGTDTVIAAVEVSG